MTFFGLEPEVQEIQKPEQMLTSKHKRLGPQKRGDQNKIRHRLETIEDYLKNIEENITSMFHNITKTVTYVGGKPPTIYRQRKQQHENMQQCYIPEKSGPKKYTKNNETTIFKSVFQKIKIPRNLKPQE